ncbi:zinc finger BED domain-containing protein DAYSLEEPER-like [Chenopodium quinoa]|uniref:zinc finger BED domain-containing protein DAYSLEEPER-like n=1 Tax=Chenopodium quinoa TaxID=63459 RepID=UPI000B78543A|nr:zinc finger BED domain-containing protein DAYSLEEPER-like [Chenopodium quinoa]XP_021731472.1 zinc finger BED domain-containing protein DAYSLEEPER-like [Chenopodium quinoa]
MEWNGSTTFRNLKDIEPKSVMDMGIISNIDAVNVALIPSEKGNDSPSSKPRKKTMTSVYLKYFETAPDGKSRRCKFCGQMYSIATATGNLGRHLGSRHPGYDKSGDLIPSTAPLTSPTVIKKYQSEAKSPKFDLDYLNWLLIKWLISSSLPPSTLEEPWLLNSFKFVNPSIQIWSKEKIQGVLCEVFRSMQEDVQTTLQQVSSKVAIALEFWTSYEQIYYMSVTCYWIDESWTFQKVLLNICRIPYPCSGAEIYHALVNVLKNYNIDDKVLACTHDNSQSAMHACHKLKEDMDGQKVGPFCYIPCAAQTLNMVIEDGLRTTKQIISKVREFVIETNASPLIMEDFIQLTTAYQEGIWRFPLDNSIRWNGHYQMMDIVRKASKSMDGVIRKHEDSLGSRMLLNAAERNAVTIMHGYLEPFYKTTSDICANKVPSIGLVLFFMDHISEMIAACKDSCHNPDWLKSAAEEMSLKSSSYNDQVSNIFTYMTAILDPRIKIELIPETLNLENNLEEARTHFLGNYSTSHFSSVNNIYCASENVDGGIVSFAEEIARKKRRASMSVATDELTQYLSEPPAPLTTDVLEWWKVNSVRYPRLSIMARDFLSVQATSVAPEELFSSKGDELERQRFGLPASTAQALLCVKSWANSGIKLKYRLSEIDYDMLMELATETASENCKLGSDKKQK